VRVLSGVLEENDRISIIEPASYDQITEGDVDAHKVRKDNFSVQESELITRMSCASPSCALYINVSLHTLQY